MSKRVQRLEAGLRGILTHDNRKLADWAERHMESPPVVDALRRGYMPTHRGASEYRGALVAVYRAIAKHTLGSPTDSAVPEQGEATEP